jgi:hypothetical protein
MPPVDHAPPEAGQQEKQPAAQSRSSRASLLGSARNGSGLEALVCPDCKTEPAKSVPDATPPVVVVERVAGVETSRYFSRDDAYSPQAPTPGAPSPGQVQDVGGAPLAPSPSSHPEQGSSPHQVVSPSGVKSPESAEPAAATPGAPVPGSEPSLATPSSDRVSAAAEVTSPDKVLTKLQENSPANPVPVQSSPQAERPPTSPVAAEQQRVQSQVQGAGASSDPTVLSRSADSQLPSTAAASVSAPSSIEPRNERGTVVQPAASSPLPSVSVWRDGVVRQAEAPVVDLARSAPVAPASPSPLPSAQGKSYGESAPVLTSFQQAPPVNVSPASAWVSNTASTAMPVAAVFSIPNSSPTTIPSIVQQTPPVVRTVFPPSPATTNTHSVPFVRRVEIAAISSRGSQPVASRPVSTAAASASRNQFSRVVALPPSRPQNRTPVPSLTRVTRAAYTKMTTPVSVQARRVQTAGTSQNTLTALRVSARGMESVRILAGGLRPVPPGRLRPGANEGVRTTRSERSEGTRLERMVRRLERSTPKVRDGKESERRRTKVKSGEAPAVEKNPRTRYVARGIANNQGRSTRDLARIERAAQRLEGAPRRMRESREQEQRGTKIRSQESLDVKKSTVHQVARARTTTAIVEIRDSLRRMPLKELLQTRSTKELSIQARLEIVRIKSQVKRVERRLETLLDPAIPLFRRLLSELSVSDLERLVSMLGGSRALRGLRRRKKFVTSTIKSEADLTNVELQELSKEASTVNQAKGGDAGEGEGVTVDGEVSIESATETESTLVADTQGPSATLTTVIVKEDDDVGDNDASFD